MSRVGKLRHWGRLQTRASAESGSDDASVSYADVTDMRCNVENDFAEFVAGRGSNQSRTPTHTIEFRRVPNMSQANYILMLNGPFKGLRFKMDETQISRLGRRIFVAAYPIGETSEFVQPTTPTLPEII